jgi:hypothetical protein
MQAIDFERKRLDTAVSDFEPLVKKSVEHARKSAMLAHEAQQALQTELVIGFRV